MRLFAGELPSSAGVNRSPWHLLGQDDSVSRVQVRPSDMTDTKSETESILDIIRGVDNKSIMLPEFQRDFRWEIEQTFDLLRLLGP
jgi:hypothetical protein